MQFRFMSKKKKKLAWKTDNVLLFRIKENWILRNGLAELLKK